MYSLFSDFQRSLFKEDLLVFSFFELGSMSADTIQPIMRKYALGIYLVLAISILMLLTTVIWQITMSIIACVRHRKPKIESQESKKDSYNNFKLMFYLGILGVLWIMLIFATCTHAVAFIRLRDGVDKVLAPLDKLEPALKSAFTSPIEKFGESNKCFIPYLAMPLAMKVMGASGKVDQKQNLLNSLLDKIDEADKQVPEELENAYRGYQDILDCSVILKEMLENPDKKVKQADIDKIIEVFGLSDAGPRFFFDDSSRFLGKGKIELKSMISSFQDMKKIAMIGLMSYVIVEFVLLFTLFSLCIWFTCTRNFRRLNIVWWILGIFMIFFLLFHVIFLVGSFATHVGCRTLSVDLPNTSSAKKLNKFGGIDMPLSGYLRLFKSCQKNPNLIESLYSAMDKGDDSEIVMFAKKLKFNYAENSINMSVRRDRLFELNLDDPKRYSIAAREFLSDAYASSKFSESVYNACKKLTEGLKKTYPSVEMNSLVAFLRSSCPSSGPWKVTKVAPFKETVQSLALTACSKRCADAIHSPFNCGSIGSIIGQVREELCGNVMSGVDGFTGVHHMLGWVGFVALIFIFLVTRMALTVSHDEEQPAAEDPKPDEEEQAPKDENSADEKVSLPSYEDGHAQEDSDPVKNPNIYEEVE